MMKRLLTTTLLFFVLGYGQVLAQCCCATNLGTFSPNLTWQYLAPSCHGYYSFQTVAGCSYEFTYCNQYAPSAYYSGDPYLTINTAPTSGGVIANDDFCGLGSYIFWTAPSSGTYYLQIGSWAQGGTCACGLNRNMGYRSTNCSGGLTSPSGITASASSICPGQSTTLTAQGVVGTAYWFTGGCNTVGQIATGNSITVSPTVTTTYYVRNFSNNQWSSNCASITVTVGQPAASPTVTGNLNLCGSGTSVLTASGSGAYTWFANSNGTNQLSTNATYTTPIINQTTTYYVQGGAAGVPPGTQTFSYTGSIQNWTVPTGVTSLSFTAEGAQGGSGTAGYGVGGLGGRVQGSLSVTPGQALSIYVGQMPLSNIGGFNGGGNGANNTYGRGGGGATDIRIGGVALANRVVVAAGGGGGGTNCFSAGQNSGGVGGGATGGNGYQCNQQTNYVGFGGSQTAGGINLGGLGQTGGLGQGGNGGTTYGGGGGGGYYGGGGGSYGGGGGGSSYALATVVSNSIVTSGVRTGNGQLTISWSGAGCPSLLVPVTVTINPAPILSVNNSTICAGQSATLTATASIQGGTFTWSPGGATGTSIVVNPTTTTQYTASYSTSGCPTTSATGTVTVNSNPLAPIASNVSLCGPGSTTLTASGGQNNSYSWFSNPNGTGQLATTATYTTPTLQTSSVYYLQATSAQNCVSPLTTVTVTINPIPIVSVNSVTVCAGQVANLTATSTVPNGTFTWSPGGNTGNSISVTPNTTTTYTASYLVSGCPSVSGTGTVTVNPLQPITGNLTACLGLNSQLANVVAPGTWSSSNLGVATISSNGLVAGVSAGTSTITYNASNGCSTTAQFTVYPQPILTATPSNVLCFGGSGSVVLNATGANAPYTYGGSPTQNLSPGTYTYTATSTNGCVSAPVSITITQPQAGLILSNTQVNVLCFGNNTGSIDLTVTGGTAPYTYAWSNNTTAQDPSNLIAGAYTVTVTDANGCAATATVTITQPASALVATTTQVMIACFGGSTGSVNMTPTGGTAPYTYVWTGGSTAQSAIGVPAGTYTVVVTDANGCTTTISATITQPQAPLSLATTQVNVLCFGNSTGSIDLSPSGGTPGYTYAWSNNSTIQDPLNLIAGTYTVVVTDANGCIDTTGVIITQPQSGLSLSSTQVNVLCFGNNTGAINLTVTGGTAPYTYAWSNNTTAQDPSNLIAGVYTVTVTDANNCTATLSITITQPTTAVSISTTVQNILCLNGTGSINSSPAGGVSPYTYSWNNQAITQNITNLQAGNYTVTVTDANGCTANAVGVVAITLSTVPVQINNSTGTNVLTCTTPAISLQATGGVTYTWTGGQTPNAANNVITIPGSYTVNMIDPNGCPVSQSIVITQNITPPTSGITNSTGSTIIDCNAPAINLLATGGGTYQWNNGLGTNAAQSISQAGSFTVVVTAANGCLDSSTVVLTVAPVPLVTGIDTTICSGQSVLITPVYYPTGGQVIWTNGQTTPNLTVTPTSTTMYSVLYTWNGCTATEDIIVTVNPTPTLSVTSSSICFGDTTAVVAQANLANGVYNWISLNQTGPNLTVFPTQTTSYTATYTLNGCTSAQATGTVTVNPLPIVSVADMTICQGQPGTLSAIVNPAGGNFAWSQGGTSATITETPSSTSVYNLTYTANGCVGNAVSASIIVLPLPLASFSVNNTSGCVPVTVSLLADTIGQNATYAWTSTGAGSQIGANPQMTFVNGGCYDVTLIATLNGCSNSTTSASLICVQNYPVANFYTSPGSFSQNNQTLSFINTSIGASGYIWNFGDGSLSNEENPNHYFQGITGDETITLLASTSMGCMDSISIEIPANLGEIYYIPNTFTPDGDKYNQVFKPVFTSGFSIDGYEMLIYNRWGELLFESHNPYAGWDGSYGLEGLDCSTGTYSYKINIKLQDKEEVLIIMGHVNLLR
jgi:gliding motility-associated-like protein